VVPLFGTDGIRGYAGRDFFSRPSLINFAEAFALFMHERFPENNGIIIIADTRISGEWIKSCLSTVFLMRGIPLYDAGVLPTPAAQTLLEQLPQCSAVLIISASHNPADDNGIKIVLKTGKMTTKDESALEQKFFSKQSLPDTIRFAHLKKMEDAELIYQATVLSAFQKTDFTGVTVALDCAHGATYRVAPALFSALGANVILCNANPDGTNINKSCGSQAPSDLQETVLKYQASIGFAFDGDGDRVIAVTRKGIVKDGDDLLVLLSQHPCYRSEQTIVGTQMSNVGCEHFFTEQKKTFMRADVGDKYVAQAMEKNQALLGGEPVGHIILADLLKSGDGIRAALRVLEQVIASNNWDLETFTKYPQAQASIVVDRRFDLTKEPYSTLLQEAELLTKGGRILVRYSGTEPLLRIMAESSDLQQAHQTVDFLKTSFTKLFSSHSGVSLS